MVSPDVAELPLTLNDWDFLDGKTVHADPAVAFLHGAEKEAEMTFLALGEDLHHAVVHVAHGTGQAELIGVHDAESAHADALDSARIFNS